MFKSWAQTIGGLCGLAGAVGGCASEPTDRPARLAAVDPVALSKVKLVLGQALNNQRIELGPEALASTTSLSVLPPPLGAYETRSTLVPEIFDIKKRGNSCFVVRRSSGQAYELKGVSCIDI
jgi:hypothetical protein